MTSELEKRLVQAYVAGHPLEAARTMEALPAAELADVLLGAHTHAAPALRLIAPGALGETLAHMVPADAGRVLSVLPLDARLAVLLLVKPEVREAILDAVEDKDADLLKRLLSYPKQSAASLVEYDTFRVTSDTTAAEALDRSRVTGSPVRYYVYVLDRDQRLVGVVSLKQLMRAGPGIAVGEFMHENPARLPATGTLAEVAVHPYWRRFPMLPVVDADERLVGVIRYETIQKLREHGLHKAGWSDVGDTLVALGEVYWLGMTTALGSPSETRSER